MNLTVKSYKSLRTRDGESFTCKLLVDGVHRANVENGGYGGPNNYIWVDGKTTKFTSYETPADVKAWMDTLPQEEFNGKMFKVSLDVLVENTINDMREEAQLKRWCKTSIVCLMPNAKPGQYSRWMRPYDKSFADRIRKTHPGVTVLNETLGLAA